jgi:hypothetical protein
MKLEGSPKLIFTSRTPEAELTAGKASLHLIKEEVGVLLTVRSTHGRKRWTQLQVAPLSCLWQCEMRVKRKDRKFKNKRKSFNSNLMNNDSKRNKRRLD